MKKEEEEIQDWCKSVASLSVDVLVDSGLVKKEDFNQAVDIVAEEILVRLIVGDYPPPFNKKLLAENTE